MNILFISTWFPVPPDNGSKLRTYYLIKALGHSHQLNVVAFQPENKGNKSSVNAQIGEGIQVCGVPEDPYRYVGLPQIAKYLSPMPLSVWPSVLMCRKVTSVASQLHWDAVVAFQSPAARYALIPISKARILDIDNSLSFMTSKRVAAATSTLSRLKARISLYKTLRHEARIMGQFDTCTVVSPLEVDFIEQMVKGTSSHVEVSANGVDCEYNQPDLAVGRSGTLVYNGSLTYSANFDAMQWFLADIYPLISQEIPNASIVITGSTRNVNTAALAMDNTVTLTGHVEDVRIPVANAEVCVVPIRQGSGTRLKILEAMALGTPVVSTSKGAEGLDVVAGEHLLIADNPRDFARNVARLLGDAALRKLLSTKARKLVVEKYNWQLIGEQFVTLVEEAVERSNNGES